MLEVSDTHTHTHTLALPCLASLSINSKSGSVPVQSIEKRNGVVSVKILLLFLVYMVNIYKIMKICSNFCAVKLFIWKVSRVLLLLSIYKNIEKRKQIIITTLCYSWFLGKQFTNYQNYYSYYWLYFQSGTVLFNINILTFPHRFPKELSSQSSIRCSITSKGKIAVINKLDITPNTNWTITKTVAISLQALICVFISQTAECH